MKKEWILVVVTILIGVPFILLGLSAASCWSPTYFSQARLQGLISAYNKELAKDPSARMFPDPIGQVHEEIKGAKIIGGKVINPLAAGLIYGGSHEVTFVTDTGMVLSGFIKTRSDGYTYFYFSGLAKAKTD